MTYEFNEIDLRKLDLNLLLAFSAVMRSGSVKAAAGRLYLGPSAVSMALSRLRNAIGDPLFLRTATGLEPTEVAKTLYARIAPALDEIASALRDRRSFDPTETKRAFRIGLSDDLEWRLFPGLIRQLSSLAHGADFDLHPADLSTAPGLLEAGNVEVTISAMLPTDASLRIIDLGSEDFVVLGAPGAALPDPMTLDAYVQRDHALVSATGRRRGLIDDRLDELDRSRRVAVTVKRFMSLPPVLWSGDLLATVPRSMGRSMAQYFGLSLRELPMPSPTFRVAMAWHRRTDADPALVWLRSEILRLFADSEDASVRRD